jgi:hypothetical protein
MNRGLRGIENRLRRFERRIHQEGWASEVLAKRLAAGRRRLAARRAKYGFPTLPPLSPEDLASFRGKGVIEVLNACGRAKLTPDLQMDALPDPEIGAAVRPSRSDGRPAAGFSH